MLLAILLLIGSERVEIRDGKLPAPGAERCVRLHATGSFARARVLVNRVNAGELADDRAELDITGYLSTGADNEIEVKGAKSVWAWLSPLVYIARARLLEGPRLEVTIVNTTENTAQVEISEEQFTVSPGTSVTREVRSKADSTSRLVHMRAVSDGMDREFVDEIEPENR